VEVASILMSWFVAATLTIRSTLRSGRPDDRSACAKMLALSAMFT
jgi:hypothetical protein